MKRSRAFVAAFILSISIMESKCNMSHKRIHRCAVAPDNKRTDHRRKRVVISFRLSAKHDQQLVELLNRDAVVGVKSTRQYARKIVMDFLAGRLDYKNPKDRFVDEGILGTSER